MCVCVFWTEIWRGNPCSLYWAPVFQSALYEVKLMQQYTTLYNWVLLHMIKSLPLCLSLNYLFLFTLLLLLFTLFLSFCFSHIDSGYPFYFSLSLPPSLSNPPTSLSDSNPPAVYGIVRLWSKTCRSHLLCFSFSDLSVLLLILCGLNEYYWSCLIARLCPSLTRIQGHLWIRRKRSKIKCWLYFQKEWGNN